MTTQDVERAILNAIAIMRYDNPESKDGWGGGKTPRDTGNLADNAIQVERVSEWEWRVYINEEIAPYMQYLNDKQGSRHYKWWGAQASKFAENISKFLGGQLQ